MASESHVGDIIFSEVGFCGTSGTFYEYEVCIVLNFLEAFCDVRE